MGTTYIPRQDKGYRLTASMLHLQSLIPQWPQSISLKELQRLHKRKRYTTQLDIDRLTLMREDLVEDEKGNLSYYK